MKLSNKTRHMLFALGVYYKLANKKVTVDSMRVVIPKTDFIRLVKEANIAEKKARAIYKNLVTLEKKKLVTYNNKELMFTVKGIKAFKEIEEELAPYQRIIAIMNDQNVVALPKKPQAVFVQKRLLFD